MSYNGYLDRKKARSFAVASGQCGPTISNTNISNTGPTGPTGPTASLGNYGQGPTGPTGQTGPTGELGRIGGIVYQSIIPGSTGLTIGSQNNVFEAGYFNTGRFGLIEVSNNAMIPINNQAYDLGSPDRRFNNIYARESHISPNTIVITDETTGKLMSMSFNVSTGGVTYTHQDTSGQTAVINAIQTSRGNANQIDANLIPFKYMRFLGTYPDSIGNVSNVLRSVFLSVPANILSSGILYQDEVAMYTSGGYLVMVGLNTLNPTIDVSFQVLQPTIPRTFTVYQEWAPTDISGDGLAHFNDGDIIIAAITPRNSTINEYTVKWVKIIFEMNRSGIVDTQNIVDAAVTADAISNNSITNIKIADNAVTTDKIQDGSIDGSKIAANSITNVHIQAGTITREKLAIGAFTPANLEPGTLTTSSFSAGFITSDLIVNSSITSEKSRMGQSQHRILPTTRLLWII